MRDRQLGRTVLVSFSNGTSGGNGTSEGAFISPDATVVYFHSEATDLVTGVNDQNLSFDGGVGGIDQKEIKTFDRMCLLSRRLVERGVRFVSRSTFQTGRSRVPADGARRSFGTFAGHNRTT